MKNGTFSYGDRRLPPVTTTRRALFLSDDRSTYTGQDRTGQDRTVRSLSPSLSPSARDKIQPPCFPQYQYHTVGSHCTGTQHRWLHFNPTVPSPALKPRLDICAHVVLVTKMVLWYHIKLLLRFRFVSFRFVGNSHVVDALAILGSPHGWDHTVVSRTRRCPLLCSQLFY